MNPGPKCDTLISLLYGMFDQVVQDTSEIPRDIGDPFPFVFRNARSAAFSHSQDYEGSTEGFESAIAGGLRLAR
jgi:hypothetical protein